MTLKQIVNKYWRYIKGASEKYGIAPEIIVGLIKQESNGNPVARSHCGAYGLTQIMPATAADRGYDIRVPRGQIYGCANYLRWLLTYYADDEEEMLAGYNAGPGRIKSGMWRLIKETSRYVPRVLKNAEAARPYVLEILVSEAMAAEAKKAKREGSLLAGFVRIVSRMRRGNKYVRRGR